MIKFYRSILTLSIIAFSIIACGSAAPTTAPATQAAPTLPPMVEPLQLKSSPFNEESQTPVYKITAQIPYLDSSDAHAQSFNTELKDVVQKEIDAFKKNLADIQPTPGVGSSSFDVQYEQVSQKGNIWSLKFNLEGYTDGAAHPYHYTITVNRDLQNDKDLTLDELFQPNSNYLQVLSDYSKAELSKRDIGFDGFQQGADPTADNYHNWNVSGYGLIITFDEYQVAPYAAGPQTVIIPFSALTPVLNPDGPIVPYLQ